MSRRELIGLVGIGASSLLIPEFAFASDGSGSLDEKTIERIALTSPDSILDLSSLPDADQDKILLQRTEAEAAWIISLLENEHGEAPSTLSAKSRSNKYTTVYGKAAYKNSGYRLVPGQKEKGVSFSTGGTIYFALSGGSKITISFGFPAPWGTISMGVSFGKFLGGSPAVGGYEVDIPGDKKRYKVWLNNEYKSIPYTIYYTDTKGKRKVYARKCGTPVIVGHDFDARRV